MRAADEDLLAGALVLAYKYADVPALRRAYARAELRAEARDGGALVQTLAEQGVLSARRAEKVRAAARLARLLRADAVYGMIAMRNKLVGGQMLNACMEEARRAGHQKTLSQVLLERGVLTATHDQAVRGRQEEVLPELLAKERALAATIDLARDAPETADLKLAMLLGEVAAKVSFLSRQDLDAGVEAQERVARGLPAEAPAPAAPPPRPAVELHAPAAPMPAPAAPGDDPSQDPIKGYELLLKLGAGAMGAVLKARKRDTGEVVALKILKPELAGDREYVERFLREAKAVARLNHPNIIRAIQTGKSGEYYFFAMEFIEGQTVSDLIKAKGKLPERFALMVTRCIASALAHAWQHQIIHRDIKPDNIMVTKDGGVKLTDLGLARTAKQESTLTITGVVMGSPAYISPEQATGEKNLDSRSDIYSLGAALFHMLTGKVPYDGETPLHVMLKHMNDPLPDAKKHVPQVAEATRQLIFKMMAKRPEGRFQTAVEAEAATRAIEEALARGEVPPVTWATPAAAPATSSAEQAPLAGSGVAKKAPAGAGAPQKKAPAPAPGKRGPDKKLGASREGGPRAASKDKDVGERLKRMAQKRKRRF
ncbi:MAG: serine/threonine protein kinase [Planctomycetes bacterium]|nr:serine/threonine protein kinase [Planctomycetota bacterium]